MKRVSSIYKEYEKAEKKREREIREILSEYSKLFYKAMGKKKVSYELKKENIYGDVGLERVKYMIIIDLTKMGIFKKKLFSFNINYGDILQESLSLKKGRISAENRTANAPEGLCDKLSEEFSLLKKVS